MQRLFAALLLHLTCLALVSPAAADALDPDEGGFIESMGQPPTWFPYVSPSGGVHEPSDDAAGAGYLTLGIFKNVLSPIPSIGVAGEGYVGGRAAGVDGGFRGLLALRPFGLGIGADYNVRQNDVDLLLSFTHPIRRGGLFGHGTRLRVDYLPTRGNSFQVGVMVPLGQRWLGKTRPKSDHVALKLPEHVARPEPVAVPGLDAAIANVRDAADWINRFTTPFFDPGGGTRDEAMHRFVERVKRLEHHIAETSALYPDGRGYPEELRVYHAELDRAFALAASGGTEATRPGESTPLGREISARAREILLDRVILPYNRLLGRIKKPDSTAGFAVQARADFELWLNRSDRVAAGAHPVLRRVFDELLEQVEENRAGSARYWETSELVWLPIRLARRSDELQSQRQLDALLERAVETPLTRGNEHHYVVNEQFQWELLRHIRQAENYHVLWIHDYRGVGNTKEIDELGYDQVYHGYMHSLIERVRRYDETGTLPVYMIFLDQNFYEPNRGRLWMSILEDPMYAKIDLPGGGAAVVERERALKEAQQELRQAVASSTLLQQRARAYGDDWLRNRVKVHVNVTNPVDWSFWSYRVIPVLGLPDVLMRDHRKISFYDVTETDPDRGEAIFTGMGVGEHYAGPTWEDRAILVTGPSLVALKDAARELVLSQGFRPDEVPYPLRPQPKPDNYAELVAEREARGLDFRSMQVHNQTGYAPKLIDVAKATLYEAMPAGSLFVVPDSLWNSPFWAGMLAGSALRGCRSYLIAPAFDNAPSAGFPQMSRGQEVFAEMIVVRQMLRDEIAATGGSLHTGIYAVDLDVGDLAGRAELHFRRSDTNPLIREFWGLAPGEAPSPELQERWRRQREAIRRELAEMGFEPGYIAEDTGARKPKLHLKAQLMLNAEAQALIRGMDIREIVRGVFIERARQVHGRTEYVDVRESWMSNGRLWQRELEKVSQEAPPEIVAEAAGFLTVGSQNMDYRGMLMDGEVLYISAGRGMMPALLDLVMIAGIATWVDDLDELEELIPAYSEWQRRLGRFMKYAL